MMSKKQRYAHIAAARRQRLDALVSRLYADYRRGLTLEEVGRKNGGRTSQSIWHLFRNRGLAIRSKHSAFSYERAASKRRARLDGIALHAHADYQRPMPLKAVARKYDTDASTLRHVFRRNGLSLRSFKRIARQPNGSPVRLVPLTSAQIENLIKKAQDIRVPFELKFEWRRWPLARRGKFIARLREKLKLPTDRPCSWFSPNVEAFDYASLRAHEIARRMNAGRNSRTAAVMIKTVSQGVLYKGKFFFWAADRGGCHSGAYYIGPWRPGIGRPALHHIIWEEFNGPIPAGHIVRARDGNPNNLDPANLFLATKNDVARENQAAALAKKSREITALLLRRHQTKDDTHALSNSLLTARR
jgi:hypothetical protein